MSKEKTSPFEIDFDSYILQSEPAKQENGKLWQTAIGLQQVDGLNPSKYLYETARRNIDGEITIEEARQLIDSYYETQQGRTEDDDGAEEAVKHLARFIANIWQIHPFGEGNTRTTAVFTIKYLNSLGFEVNNEPFENNSWYFRNALVRANYTNMNKGIYMNTDYLEKFFRNLLLGEHNELKNRFCHIRAQNLPVNDKNPENKGKNLPVNLPVNKTQRAILELLLENNRYTYDELAAKINKTRETVRINLRTLEKMKLLIRDGADKNGFWIVHI